MPPFNPEVPSVNPANTAFWARPIEQPKADVSKETLFKGIGQSFDEAVTGLDDWVKQGLIRPIEQKDLEAKRDEFADALNSAREYMTAPPSAGDKPTLMGSGENIPTAVSQVGDRIQTLHDSMTGGHLSETKYYGDINNYLRRMRSLFPGYVDYIDQEAYRITGVRAANQEIRSQISDLNRLLSEHSDAKDKWHTAILANAKYFSGDEIQLMNNLHAQNPEKFGLDQLAVEKANREHELFLAEKNKAEFEQGQRDATTQGKLAATALNDAGASMVGQFYRMGTIAALNTTPQQFIEDVHSGRMKEMTPEQITNAVVQLQAKRAAIVNDLTSLANAPHGDKGSYMNALKGQSDTSWESILKAQLEPLDEVIKLIDSKEHDIASLTQHQYQIRDNDARNKLDKADQETGGLGTKNKWIKDHLGDAAQSFWFQKNFPKITKQLDDILPLNLNNALYQPGLQPGGNKHVTTMKESFDDIKRLKGPEKAYDEVMSWHELINKKDVKPEAKMNLVHFFYSAADQNWATLRDHNIKNPEVLYQQLFDPITSKTIAKLGPQAWQEYQGAASALASTVFGNNFHTLANYQESPDMKFAWHSDKGIDVIGNPKQRELPERVKGLLTGNVPEINIYWAKRAQNQINTVYQGLKSVFDNSPYKKEGEDAETTMIDIMLERGFNPNIPGIPATIMQNIIAARSKPKLPPAAGGE